METLLERAERLSKDFEQATLADLRAFERTRLVHISVPYDIARCQVELSESGLAALQFVRSYNLAASATNPDFINHPKKWLSFLQTIDGLVKANSEPYTKGEGINAELLDELRNRELIRLGPAHEKGRPITVSLAGQLVLQHFREKEGISE